MTTNDLSLLEPSTTDVMNAVEVLRKLQQRLDRKGADLIDEHMSFKAMDGLEARVLEQGEQIEFLITELETWQSELSR